MNFYVPFAKDGDEAEIVWAATRAFMSDLGLATTGRRIAALLLREGSCHLVEVGGETPDGEPVMVILESRDAEVFYVCTPYRGVLEGPPYVLGLTEHGRAVDFSEEVVGWA